MHMIFDVENPVSKEDKQFIEIYLLLRLEPWTFGVTGHLFNY